MVDHNGDTASFEATAAAADASTMEDPLAPMLTMQPLHNSPEGTLPIEINTQGQPQPRSQATPISSSAADAPLQSPNRQTPTAGPGADDAASTGAPSITSSVVNGIIEDAGAASPRPPRAPPAAAAAAGKAQHRYANLSIQERTARARDKISAGSRSPALQKDYKKTYVNIMLYGESGLGKTVSAGSDNEGGGTAVGFNTASLGLSSRGLC
jgi:hypothetical protein